MSRIRSRTLAVAVAVLLAAAVAPATVAADEDDDDSLIDETFSASGTLGTLADWLTRASANVFRATDAIGAIGEDRTVEDYSDGVKSFANDHNTSFIDWVNARSTVTESEKVYSVTLQDSDGREDTIYVVGDANTTAGNFTSGEVHESLPDGRTVDKEFTLSPYASRNAESELKRFHEDFVSQDKDLTREYLAEMAARYNGEIEGPVPE